ncbi:HAD family hydrolase [Haloferax larsenii]|uniref:HAD family hydrolase n=1 Tax=Haloferax larsenii TaxID=302484 RepID=A0ABY5RJF4_HALLR|nr:HAD family hydrolase [Haloferax larsenii]UVE51707.1 HAD family hydrolase [Haloferax larsenii]
MGDNISTVLFDLDDTLCEYRRSEADRLANAFTMVGVEPFFTPADVERLVPTVNAESLLDLRLQVFGVLAKENDREPATARRLAHAYEDPDHTNVVFCAGASDALDTLCDDYKLGLVTNGGKAAQQAKLDTLGIADSFDAAVFATPESAVKPDTDPFERALRELGSEPDESVHVGDSLASDVAGANAAGLTSVWVSWGQMPESCTVPDYTVRETGDVGSELWRS